MISKFLHSGLILVVLLLAPSILFAQDKPGNPTPVPPTPTPYPTPVPGCCASVTPASTSVIGYVACCNGVKHECVSEDNMDNYNPNPTPHPPGPSCYMGCPGSDTRATIVACIEKHERNHIQYPNLVCPPGGEGPAGTYGTSESNESECRAYTEQLTCITSALTECNNKIAQCSVSPTCSAAELAALQQQKTDLTNEQTRVSNKKAYKCSLPRPTSPPTQIPTPIPTPTLTPTPTPDKDGN
jgi:hypothetical protein